MTKFDSSYDRDQARRLAAQLTGKNVRKEQAVSHSHAFVPASGPADAAVHFEEVPSISFQDKNSYRDQVWQKLLAWACKLTAGSRAFVCDSNGLVIADSGEQSDSSEEIPSVLAATIADLKRYREAEDSPLQLVANLGKAWVTGITVCGETHLNETDELVLGFVGQSCPALAALEKVRAVFSGKLSPQPQ